MATTIIKDTEIETVVVQVPGLMGPRAELPWELSIPVQGRMYANELLLRYDSADKIDFELADCFASCDIPATVDAEFIITVDGTQVGTILFAAGSNEGVVTLSALSINKREILSIWAPAIQDVTLADLTITLKGKRD